MQAVVLAGGLGTRLRPLTHRLPKPMVPIAGKPLLEWQIDHLARQGFRRFLLLTGHLGEQVRDHFRDGGRFGVAIDYSQEETPLGTGGALRAALGRLEERFLLLYGDSFLAEDYAAIGGGLREAGTGGLMVVFQDEAGRTGVAPNVALDAAGRVVRYAKGETGPDLRYVEAGAVGLAAAEVARLAAGLPASLERDLYPALVAEGRMRAWVTTQPFYDIGTPEGMRRAERFFREASRGGGSHGRA